MATIDKHVGDPFNISVTFMNSGDTPGTWTVNALLSGDWSWTGTPQSLTLDPGASQTLTWTGTVPNVPACKTAQLFVQADGTTIPEDAYIHVIEGVPTPTSPALAIGLPLVLAAASIIFSKR